MCLVKKSFIPRIALYPKRVYKLINRIYNIKKKNYDYITPYAHYPIKIGETYIGEFKYSTLTGSFTASTLNDGYIHCFKDLKSARNSKIFGRPVECIIPAGTLYWIGVGGEIATRKLKYIKLV